MSLRSRLIALVIASLAWTGLAVQFLATHAAGFSLSASVAILLAYFTISTNLLVALLFTAVAAGSHRAWLPSALAGVTLSILMVGIIYALLLRGLHELSGGSLLADTLLHQVTPIAVPLFWLFFAPKGRLHRTDRITWAAYPLLYFLYALTRGAITGLYAYPFLNVPHLGWLRVLLNAILIATIFLLAGLGLTHLDRSLTRRKLFSGTQQPATL